MAIDPISLAISVALTAASMAVTASQSIEGPRLTDLSVTVADYGTPVNYFEGIRRLEPPVFFAEPIHETKQTHKTKGGKYSEYIYAGTFAVLVADQRITAYRRLWLDRHLVWDAVGPDDRPTRQDEAETAFLGLLDSDDIDDMDQVVRFYFGTEEQFPDERMQATVEAEEGPDTCPAYLGNAYVMFEGLPLKNFGNRFPQVSVEAENIQQFQVDLKTLSGGDDSSFFTGYFFYADSPDGSKTVWADGRRLNSRYLVYDNTRGAYAIREVVIADIIPGLTFCHRPVIDNAGNVYFTDSFNAAPTSNGRHTYKVTPSGIVTQIGTTADIPIGDNFYWRTDELLTVNGVDTLFYKEEITGASPSGIVYSRPLTGGQEPVEHISSIEVLNTFDSNKGCFTQGDNGDVWFTDVDASSITTLRFWRIAGTASAGDFHTTGGLPDLGDYQFVHERTCRAYNGKFYPGWGQFGTPPNVYLVKIDQATFALEATCDVSTETGCFGTPRTSFPRIGIESGPPPIDSLRNQAVFNEYDSTGQYKKVHRIDLATMHLATATVENWPPTVEIASWPDKPRSVFPPTSAFYPETLLWNDHLGGLVAFPYDFDHYPDAVAYLFIEPSEVMLRDILNRVARQAGFPDESCNFSALDQLIYGYSWTQGRGADIVTPPTVLHDSDVRPNGFIQEGIKRGRPLDGPEIREEWFATKDGGARYTITVVGDTDLPRRASVVYADRTAEQQPNTAAFQRKLGAVTGQREVSIDATPYSADPDVMQPLVERLLRRPWIGSVKGEFGLTPRHKLIRPGDVRNIVFDNEYIRGRFIRVTMAADRSLSVRIERDGAVPLAQMNIVNDDGVIVTPASQNWDDDTGTTISDTPASPGAVASGRPPPHVFSPVDLWIFVLDIPLFRDADDSTTPFMYYAAGPIEAGDWPGGTILESDSGSEGTYGLWASIGSTSSADHGVAVNALPDALTSVIDEGTQLIVQVANGVLESISDDEFYAGDTNQIYVNGEICKFRDAVLQSDGEYILSTLMRGLHGTEQFVATHGAGERVLLLDNVFKHDMGASKIGDTDYYKGVTVAKNTSAQPGFSLEFDAVANKPLSPVHLQLSRDVGTGDWSATWFRRSRIGGANLNNSDIPLGETSELYRIRILDGLTVVNTYESTTTDFVYTAAMQGTDWGSLQTSLSIEVVQVSPALNLEGFSAEASA